MRFTRQREERANRATFALAAAAAATAGTVIAGEVMKRGRKDAVAVAVEGYAATPRHETVLFNLLAGSLGAFTVARISTYGMRAGWWPFGNVFLGGRHIHHFVPGILLTFGSGVAALLTENQKFEETLALPFGVGLGLTLDEAALLLNLSDVYWTPEGVLSVQVSLGAAALMGGTILGLRILRRGEEEVDLAPSPLA